MYTCETLLSFCSDTKMDCYMWKRRVFISLRMGRGFTPLCVSVLSNTLTVSLLYLGFKVRDPRKIKYCKLRILEHSLHHKFIFILYHDRRSLNPLSVQLLLNITVRFIKFMIIPALLMDDTLGRMVPRYPFTELPP